MPTTVTNIQIVRQLAVKQHGAAFITLGPKVIRCLAAREDRVNPRPDIVGNPVHTFGPFWVCYLPDNLVWQ